MSKGLKGFWKQNVFGESFCCFDKTKGWGEVSLNICVKGEMNDQEMVSNQTIRELTYVCMMLRKNFDFLLL